MIKEIEPGLVQVNAGNYIIGFAPNIDDIPMALLDVFCQYFSKTNKIPFNVYFEGQEYTFGLTEYAGQLYALKHQPGFNYPRLRSINNETFGMEEYDTPGDCLKKIGLELVEDIERDIGTWVRWEAFTIDDNGDPANEVYYEKRKSSLLEKKDILKKELSL